MGVKIREKIKGSNDWWLFINHRGRRRSKHIGDRKTAKILAEKVRAKLILDPDTMEGDVPLFKDYALKWLESFIKITKKKDVYENYREILKIYIIPVLGKKKLNQIKIGNVRDLILKIYTEKPLDYIKRIENIINSIMCFAIGDGIIENDLEREIRRQKMLRQLGLKDNRKNTDVLNEEIEEIPLFKKLNREWIEELKYIHKHQPLIYFIQEQSNGYIKIGITANLKKRLIALQTANPNKLILIGCIIYLNKEKAKETESNFHKNFSHLKINGEWFQPKKELRDFLEIDCKAKCYKYVKRHEYKKI